MCLACVFNNLQVVLSCDIKNGVHIDHLSIEMHWNDCCHRIACFPVESTLQLFVPCTLCLQILSQLCRVHRVGSLLNVNKIWTCPSLGNCLGRGNESIRDCNHDIAG